jgi:hypothetical protein
MEVRRQLGDCGTEPRAARIAPRNEVDRVRGSPSAVRELLRLAVIPVATIPDTWRNGVLFYEGNPLLGVFNMEDLGSILEGGGAPFDLVIRQVCIAFIATMCSVNGP